MAANIHVSISAEPLFELAGITITNSMATGAVVSLLLIALTLYASSSITKKKTIGRIQALVELIVENIYNLTKDVAGEKKARDFFPLIASSLIFILANNWVSVMPGVGTITIEPQLHHEETSEEGHALIPQAHATEVTQDLDTTESAQMTEESSLEEDSHSDVIMSAEEEHQDESEHMSVDNEGATHSKEAESHSAAVPIIRPATASLNTTLALALISVLATQYFGIKYLGANYFTKFFNFKQGPVFTFVGFLELISEFAKIVSFAFRLFGNIFAGEVLLTVILFLSMMIFSGSYLPLPLLLPFLGLELFVGLIQAVVFAMLTLVFTNMATISHDDH